MSPRTLEGLVILSENGMKVKTLKEKYDIKPKTGEKFNFDKSVRITRLDANNNVIETEDEHRYTDDIEETVDQCIWVSVDEAGEEVEDELGTDDEDEEFDDLDSEDDFIM